MALPETISERAIDYHAVRADAYGIIRRRLSAALGRPEHASLEEHERALLSHLVVSLRGNTVPELLEDAHGKCAELVEVFAAFVDGIDTEIKNRCEKCGVMLDSHQRFAGQRCTRHAAWR